MDKCPKCGGRVTRKGTMHSGNSKYAIFKCEACGHEAMECEGLE